MLLALILVATVTVLLCWLLFSLASLALPLFVGVAAGQVAHQAGAGLLGAILLGLLAGAGTLFAGQFLLATLRNSVSRTALVALFAAPAAVAGYNAGYGIAAIGGVSAFAQLVLGVGAAICVAVAAIGRLCAGIPDAPGDDASTVSPMDAVPSASR